MKIGKLLGVAVMVGIIGGICYTTGALDDAQPVINDLKRKAEEGIEFVKSFSENPKAIAEVFINGKKQGLEIEDQIDGLQEAAESAWDDAFYICDGEEFSHQWNNLDGNNFELIQKALTESESNCIWFEDYEAAFTDSVRELCYFYNVDDKTLVSKIEELKNKPASWDGSYDIFAMSKSAQKFALKFNKDYRNSNDIKRRIERRIDESFEFNMWRDSDWDGMNVDEFYQKYKITTKISQPVLKKILTGTMKDARMGNEMHFAKNACFLIEFDLTNISSEEHPLEWFPQSGETKTIQVMMQGTFDPYGNFCLSKGGIYK